MNRPRAKRLTILPSPENPLLRRQTRPTERTRSTSRPRGRCSRPSTAAHVASNGKQHWQGTPTPIPGLPEKLDDDATFVQDGSNVAWTTSSDPSDADFQDTVYLSAGDGTRPRIVYKVPEDEQDFFSVTLDVLSGPYLFFDTDQEANMVVDIRTSATATLDSDGETFVMPRAGVIVFSSDTVDMALAHTDTLPELRC